MRGAPVERFFAKVEKTETCWLWTAATINGYGRFTPNGGGKQFKAHRWSYELHNGPIPEGLTLDHLCRVRNCVNPDHLEAVTMAENQARRPAKSHCSRGHEYTEANTYYEAALTPGGRTPKHCRACNRIRTQARYHATRAVEDVA